jgi:adenylate cyclase
MSHVSAIFRHRIGRGIALGLMAFAIALAALSLRVAEPLEWKSWDLRLRLFADPSRASPDIVIFLIDQYSLDVYERQQGLSWPWPRQLYSAVVDYLRTGRAKAVFFDLVFSESSRSGVEDDEDFARAMERSGAVFLPLSLSRQESLEEVPAEALRPFALPFETVPQVNFPSAESVSLPVDVLLRAARGAGNVSFVPDGDGVFRRLPLAVSYRNLLIPSAPLVLARYILGNESLAAVPLDREGRMIIRYYGPAGTYKTYSIAAIINSWAQLEEGGIPQIPPSEFEGKTVFIAGSAAGILDSRPTPLTGLSPGVEIHAAVLDNVIHRDFIRGQPRFALVASLLLFSLLTAVGASNFRKIWQLVVFLVLCLALPAAAAGLAFAMGYWAAFVVPEIAVLVGFIGAALMNYSVEGKQRRFIKSVFRHYLSPDVIERIIANPSLLELGGEKREITSFFSDVAGFTSISEGLSPEDLVALLNEYLSEMTDIILSEGGTLDKYEGDAIIAFWNAPLNQPDHRVRACRAALRCQERLAELGPHFEAKIGRPLAMRIGLNSGPAVVGNMGSRRRFDYTAMGDTVNLASRLEGAGKLYKVSILAGEDTCSGFKDAVVAREIDTIRVVGKKKPVAVFEIIGESGRTAESDMERLGIFARAKEAYRRRAWAAAAALFAGLKGDPVAELYLERCKEFGQSPPPVDWDGVFDLVRK